MNFVYTDPYNLGDTITISVTTSAASQVFHKNKYNTRAFIIHNSGLETAYLTFNGDTADANMFELRENERITVNLYKLGYIGAGNTTLKLTELLDA